MRQSGLQAEMHRESSAQSGMRRPCSCWSWRLSVPAEAPPFTPRVPPTSPIFERSIQEQVAANTNRLLPAKEKSANEKASMVSSLMHKTGRGYSTLAAC